MADNETLAGLLGSGTKQFLEYLKNTPGAAVDWLARGAQTGAEPTLALMRGDAADQPFLPTADSGGRVGAIASALTGPMMPIAAPKGALGAGPVFRAADKGLDMSPEARAARAAEQGYADQPFYHATGRDFEAFDLKTAGTGSNAGNAEKAVFLTDNPAVADTYLGGAHVNMNSPAIKEAGAADLGDGVGRYYNKGSQVMPLRVRGMDDFDTWDMGGNVYNAAEMKQMLKDARKAKLPGVVFENFRDPGIMSTGRPKASTVVAVLDPSRIRSPHAAFDPAQAKSKNILASRAPLPAAPQTEEQKRAALAELLRNGGA